MNFILPNSLRGGVLGGSTKCQAEQGSLYAQQRIERIRGEIPVVDMIVCCVKQSLPGAPARIWSIHLNACNVRIRKTQQSIMGNLPELATKGALNTRAL